MTSILLATDAPWVAEELTAALCDTETSVRVVNEGRNVLNVVNEDLPDLIILDLQIGSMGGVATSLDIRADEGMGRLAHIPILLLCDRRADVFLARRSQADGFLVKPIEPLRLRRAVRELLAGETFEDSSYAPTFDVATHAGATLRGTTA